MEPKRFTRITFVTLWNRTVMETYTRKLWVSINQQINTRITFVYLVGDKHVGGTIQA